MELSELQAAGLNSTRLCSLTGNMTWDKTQPLRQVEARLATGDAVQRGFTGLTLELQRRDTGTGMQRVQNSKRKLTIRVKR